MFVTYNEWILKGSANNKFRDMYFMFQNYAQILQAPLYGNFLEAHSIFFNQANFDTPSQKLHNPPDPSEYCEWKPHFFVLTESKMFYSEACNNDERENDEESEDEGGSVSNLPTVS